MEIYYIRILIQFCNICYKKKLLHFICNSSIFNEIVKEFYFFILIVHILGLFLMDILFGLLFFHLYMSLLPLFDYFQMLLSLLVCHSHHKFFQFLLFFHLYEVFLFLIYLFFHYKLLQLHQFYHFCYILLHLIIYHLDNRLFVK